MVIVFTSKVDEYEASPEQGLNVIRQLDYYFYGKKRSVFSIAEVESDTARVKIQELTPNGSQNSIPFKFFEQYETADEAETELQQLVKADPSHLELKRKI